MTPITLFAQLNLQAASGGKQRKFSITGYSGGELVVSGFNLPVVIDLDGLVIPANVPILLDHTADVESTLGQANDIRNNGRSLVLTGAITGQSDRVRRVVAQADAGHDFQASVGCSVEQQEQVPAGQTVSVNGQRFTGPIIVARRSVLRETSVLPVGADASTSVNLAARAAILKGNTMPTTAPSMSFDEWITEHGIDPKTMTPELTALITPIFDAEQNGTQPPTPAAAEALVNLQAAAALDRIANINRIASGHPQIAAAAIRAGWSALETENHVLKENQKMRAPSNYRTNGGSNIGTTSDHITASIMVRAGYTDAAEKQFGANVMEQSRPLHGNSLVDMCRASLIADGRDIPSGRGEMIRAALSTGSMPVALGDSANKILISAYQQAPASWRSFAAVKPAANFKTQTGIRPTWAGDLTRLPPGGSIVHGNFSEETYPWQIATFAKQFGIDRQDIIDDDANVFSDTIPGLARAAARSLNSLVSTTLLNNASSFFGSANNNYFEGAATNLQASSLATAIKMLRQMTDADGSLLDLSPAVLLVPPELEQVALGLVNSSEVARQTATDGQLPTGNTFKDVATVVVEPRLSTASFTGYSAVAWYLFAAPQNAAVIVGFLNGMENPTLEQFGLDHDVNKLAYSFRCYHDYGVALADHRAAIRSKGAV